MAPRPLHPAMAFWCHVQCAKVVRRPPPLLEVRTPIAIVIWGIKPKPRQLWNLCFPSSKVRKPLLWNGHQKTMSIWNLCKMFLLHHHNHQSVLNFPNCQQANHLDSVLLDSCYPQSKLRDAGATKTSDIWAESDKTEAEASRALLSTPIFHSTSQALHSLCVLQAHRWQTSTCFSTDYTRRYLAVHCILADFLATKEVINPLHLGGQRLWQHQQGPTLLSTAIGISTRCVT